MKFSGKRIGFRVDASKALGLGHLFRCKALADGLEGADIVFWTKEDPDVEGILYGETVDYVVPGMPVHEEIDWLTTRVRSKKLDALIVDFLIYPEGYLDGLKQAPVKLISFHELERDNGVADIAINYNTFRGFDRYPKSAKQKSCLGPEYIILREGVRRFRPIDPSEKVRTVLISMGGSDPNGNTLKLINSLSFHDHRVGVIIHMGPAFKYRRQLREVLDRTGGDYIVEENVKELAEIMVKADIAIASGGNTMYELCYLGIPSIIVSQNIHQHEFATELDRLGAVISLGSWNDLDESTIAGTFESLCSDHALRKMMSMNATGIIDGKGIERILSKIDRQLTQ